jgi:predicted O-linked N-acetylglucosamine transferase (SPINDLY family)
MSDRSIATLLNRAMVQQNAGHMAEAESLYREIVARDANHAHALHMLGVLACSERGDATEALELVRRAISADPQHATMAHCTAGQILVTMGKPQDAAIAFGRSLALQPEPSIAPDITFELAKCLHAIGCLDEAMSACNQVLAVRPDHAETLNLLGNLFYATGKTEQSIDAFRRAAAIQPDSHFVHNNLGNAFHEDWRLDEAEAALRRAIALRPDFDLAHANLGNVLKDLGRLDEALAEMRAAVDLNPQNPVSRSNLLFALHLDPKVGPQQILRENRTWNDRHARPLRASITSHRNDRSPDRRLRIGYVSPDFREHPVGRCLLPILRRHDRQQFEITCYSATSRVDAATDVFRSVAACWRDVSAWADERLAEQIRQDGIDILIDLALHSEGGRLLTFARKPAPIQITFAGYPSTTGLEAIDYRISDAFLDEPTPDRDKLYVEQSLRLPHTCFGCFEPEGPPTLLNPPPVEQNGFISFVSLNNFAKVTPGIIELWASLLRALPAARLTIRAPMGSAQKRLHEGFLQRGVDPPRIDYVGRVPRAQYFKLFHRFDIFLDTFPYTGHTTTIDSLWMGVPVVTLAGQTAVSRGSFSILSEIGHPELTARSPEAYTRIATELAADVSRLRQLRSSLRDRLRASALMDAARFTSNLESVYRRIWKRWCADPSPWPP